MWSKVDENTSDFHPLRLVGLGPTPAALGWRAGYRLKSPVNWMRHLNMSSPVLCNTQRRLLLCGPLRLFQIYFVFSICRIKPTVRNTCGRRMSEACQTDCSLVHTMIYFLLNWSTVKCFLPVMHCLFFLHFCYFCCFMGEFSISYARAVNQPYECYTWSFQFAWSVPLRLGFRGSVWAE